MQLLIIVVMALLIAGCATAPSKPPAITPHAEAGVGITVWKIPVAGLGLWFPSGYGAAGSQVVIHQYSYQAVPKAEQYGVPIQPPGPPTPVLYPTLYPQAPFDDPTLVVFVNQSQRVTLRLTIDEEKERREITLRPGETTANIHLDVGDHNVRVRGEVPTVLGARQIPERVFPLRVDPRGRSHIVYLAE